MNKLNNEQSQFSAICTAVAIFLGLAIVPAQVGADESPLRYLTVESNYSLQHMSPGVTTAIIMIHGDNRNADFTMGTMREFLKGTGQRKDVLLIAPRFITASDGPRRNEAYWSIDGWKLGNKSLDDRRISSFEVLDDLIKEIVEANFFHNLKHVTIAGHSAGAQFVLRYAAGSSMRERMPLSFSFAVANPSSYLYLDDLRPFPTAGCPDYNDYHYGLDQRNSYMRRSSRSEIRQRYLGAKISYILGEDDTDSGHSGLDTSCAAQSQGSNRLERGTNYHSYLTSYVGQLDDPLLFDTFVQQQPLNIVAGVGHSSRDIFLSEQSVEALIPPAPDEEVEPPAPPHPYPWQNPVNPFDVNNDGTVSADDALLLITELNREEGARMLPSPDPEVPATIFFDVSGDNWLTPLDVIMVINEL